jgi:hypothetical protein
MLSVGFWKYRASAKLQASTLVPVISKVETGCDLIKETRRYYFKLGWSGDPLVASVCSVKHLPSTRVLSAI